MRKKIKITETQYNMIKEHIGDSDATLARRKLQMAYHSLKTIIDDFMLNGNVDPEYKQSIQQELDTINRLSGN